MSHRLEIGLALLLAVAIAVAVWAGNRAARPPEPDSRASTFVSGPNGSKALYDVLVRLGRPVERRRTPLFNFNDSVPGRSPPGLLVLANPPIELFEAEIDAVVEFVRGGGAVFAARHGGGLPSCLGWRIAPDEYVADSLRVRRRADWRRLRIPAVTRTLERAPRARPPLARLRKGDAPSDPCDPLAELAEDTLLATVEGRPVAIRFRYAGGGTITLLAEVSWLRNRVWRDTDVAVIVLPWLTPPPQAPRPRVTWAEYHQGFGAGRQSLETATWAWLRETPTGWAILQLIGVALVWLGVSAVRFGPPRAVIERRRRSPLEHLEALAAGLESAGAARAAGRGGHSEAAVQRIVAGLRRRLSRTGATVDRGPIGPWLDTLELVVRGARGREAVRRLQLLVRGAKPEVPAGDRVLATAQAVEDVWEELRPRMTRDAS